MFASKFSELFSRSPRILMYAFQLERDNDESWNKCIVGDASFNLQFVVASLQRANPFHPLSLEFTNNPHSIFVPVFILRFTLTRPLYSLQSRRVYSSRENDSRLLLADFFLDLGHFVARICTRESGSIARARARATINFVAPRERLIPKPIFLPAGKWVSAENLPVCIPRSSWAFFSSSESITGSRRRRNEIPRRIAG